MMIATLAVAVRKRGRKAGRGRRGLMCGNACGSGRLAATSGRALRSLVITSPSRILILDREVRYNRGMKILGERRTRT